MNLTVAFRRKEVSKVHVTKGKKSYFQALEFESKLSSFYKF